jgi:(S)-2-hydroxyglutarate dehydrogenase
MSTPVGDAGTPGAPEGEFDIAVIGAGVVGLATAMALLEQRPGLRLAVLEKEQLIGTHQTEHNSGVIHAGLYYPPGSLKAQFCREGRLAMLAFAEQHGVPYRTTGKLVVATEQKELFRLGRLAERGRLNGLALREISASEIAEMEPNVRGVAALHVPETGVIDFRAVALKYAEIIARAGGEVLCGRGVRSAHRSGSRWSVVTGAGEFRAGVVVSCAGLQADRVAAMTSNALTSNGSDRHRIVPFRGDYYTFRPHARDLVHGLVYPVPDPAFPFLGVHFTRGIDGSLVAGPNAVPALAREGYARTSFRARDVIDTVAFPGFLRLAKSYARSGAREIWRDLVKPAYVAQMRRYLPMLTSRDVSFGPSGIRAQCVTRAGVLVDDFLVEESEGVVHLLNAPSPAASASIVIGRDLAARALAQLGG